MKPRLHFYGKYMGDMKIIFNTIKSTNDYDISYDLTGFGSSRRIRNPQYIITSHSMPNYVKNNSKEVHMRHGYGVFPWIPDKNKKDELLKDYEKFYGFRIFGDKDYKVFKDWGIPEKRLMMIGLPFSVDLLSLNNNDERIKFLKSKNLDPEKNTILYAPTWTHYEERGFFVEWYKNKEDEKEKINSLCKFITEYLNCNFIIRFHEKHRYNEDYLNMYKDILNKENIYSTYLVEDEVDNISYLKYTEVLIGDLSSVNVWYYVMDKPVVHIGLKPFFNCVNKGLAGLDYDDRVGYVTDNFNIMLDNIEDSLINPYKFSDKRQTLVSKCMKYMGKQSTEAIKEEFKRVCIN